MDEIHETLKGNQLLARKFDRIEKRLSDISSPDSLFENLLAQIKQEFSVPFVWVSLINNGPLSGIIGVLKASNYLKDRINFVDESVLLELAGHSTSPVLANRDLHPFYKLLPGNITYFIKSLAVAPLTMDGAIAGSLNLGDYSPGRYRPGMDTDLLQRLVNSFSDRLSVILTRKEGVCTPTGGEAGENDKV